MKKQEKEFLKYTEKKVSDYLDLFNLNNWQVTIPQEIKKSEDGTLAETNFVDEGYTKVTLNVYDNLFEYYKQKRYKELERTILHEITHILIRDFECAGWNRFQSRDDYREKRERLCEDISVIIHRLLR